MTPSGIWLDVHENQAVLIDAPFAWEDASSAIEHISGFLRNNDLQLKYVTASHLHLDHSAGLTVVLDHFSDATFVYPARWKEHWNTISIDRIKYGMQPAMSRQWDRIPHKAYENCFSTDLAGEPLYFMEAPYHSLTDQLLIFRGVALLPDWHLPTAIDEPLQLVDAPPSDVADTITRLRHFERDIGYEICRSCAVHGDEPVRSDFQERLGIAYQRFVTPTQHAEITT